MTRRHYLLLAALLGLTIGVGLGFRQDVFVCILPAVPVVAVCARGRTPISPAWRAGATFLLLVSFLLPGWPILSANHRTSGNTAHYLLQGMALGSERDLRLRDASYQRVYSNNDNFIHSTVVSYDRRQHPSPAERSDIDFWSPEADAAGKSLLARFAWAFPSDFLNRGYASTRWMITQGIEGPAELNPFLQRMQAWQAPIANHIRRFGLLYAAVALAFVGSQNILLALIIMILALYLGGYTSLQFHHRHAFHLGFAALWLPAFTWERSCCALLRMFRRPLPGGTWRRFLTEYLRPGLLRALCAAALSLTLLLAPLYALRLYQRANFATLLDAYAHAELEPVSVVQQDVDGQIQFTLAEPLPSLNCSPDASLHDVAADYLVAELAPSTAQRTLTIQYEADNNAVNFTEAIPVTATGQSDSGPTRQFFPVYACAAPKVFEPGKMASLDPAQWSRGRFVGLRLPASRAAEFRGLYRVRNAGQFPMFLLFTLPAERDCVRPYQTLGFWASSTSDFRTEVP